MTSAKSKILVWAVVLLIIVNLAVLATIWFMHRGQEHPHRGTPADYLVEQLKLNDDQKKKLHEMAEEHHKSAELIKQDVKNARDSFFKMLQQSNVSDSMKKAGADNIAKNLERLELLTFDHFQQVRSICTPEQQKKFDEIIQDVLRMIGSQPPPRGPGNPPPGPGGPGDRMPPP